MLKRPPPTFPPIRKHTLKAGARLYRNHLASYPAGTFNPGLGTQRSRFSPFRTATGDVVPTLYAATSLEAAAFETIFHDIDADAPFKTVPLDGVLARAVSDMQPRRDLMLAPLFSPDLKAWGLRRTDLVDTDKSDYDETVLWAAAIHAGDLGLDGLIWTSRQCDPDCCVVLFGDRVGPDDLEVSLTRKVSDDDDLLRELRTFGQRAGISIIG